MVHYLEAHEDLTFECCIKKKIYCIPIMAEFFPLEGVHLCPNNWGTKFHSFLMHHVVNIGNLPLVVEYISDHEFFNQHPYCNT